MTRSARSQKGGKETFSFFNYPIDRRKTTGEFKLKRDKCDIFHTTPKSSNAIIRANIRWPLIKPKLHDGI